MKNFNAIHVFIFQYKELTLNHVRGLIRNTSNGKTHSYCLKIHDSFHSKAPSTTKQIAVNYTASMLSSSSDDSGDER